MQRFIHSVLLIAVLAATIWLLPLVLLAPAAAAQEGPSRAALVVRFADGAVETRCVSFATPAISGADLLARSGLPRIVNLNSGLGGAVCSIKGQGCAFPGQDCFCRCQGSACEYWAYYHLSDRGWVYSDVGAGNFLVTDGAVEGWSWGKGNFTSGTEPPVAHFADICPAIASAVTGPVAANSAASSTSADRSATAGQAPAAGYGAGDAASLPRYASFALFAAALAGGWVWLLTRRKRSSRATEASS
ncbi:MAG: hypothetical protein QG637_1052 [Chloroflexota bacterium]|nr:hypothetical protein [Chloroflexota bacterium]